MEGFEPPNAGTKTRCLTTWRHPNNRYGSWVLYLRGSRVSTNEAPSIIMGGLSRFGTMVAAAYLKYAILPRSGTNCSAVLYN